VRVLPGKVGFQHRAGDDGRIRPRQSARAQGVFEERAQADGRNASGGLGFRFGQHMGTF